MLRLKEELLKDRDAAFDYMLPKESQEVEMKKQELCFFSNQCWDELRRVSKDNGILLADHFKDMGALHCIKISSVRYYLFLTCYCRTHKHGRISIPFSSNSATKTTSRNWLKEASVEFNKTSKKPTLEMMAEVEAFHEILSLIVI
jgi:hypothetical protein